MRKTKVLLLMAASATLALAQAPANGGRGLQLQETAANVVAGERGEVALTRGSGEKARAPQAALRGERAFSVSPAATDGRATHEMPGCNVTPASPAIGTDVPLTYFGAPSSTVNSAFVGRLQLLTAGQLNEMERTITLPLYEGRMARTGESVWYILTDTTDKGNSEALGLNYSPKLNYAATGRGVRSATLMRGGVLEFESGRVDFAPVRSVRPGAGNSPFPPAEANPGSVGDSSYTPLVRIMNAGGHIYNAPMIAFNATPQQMMMGTRPNPAVVHDKVVALNFSQRTVTLSLAPGFSAGRPVLYLSTEASAGLVAAMEGATLAPGLTDIAVGSDDAAFSATERIFLVVNGARGCDNPQRQGLEAALTDGGAPMNVLGGIPTLSTNYSPLWDINLGEWTPAARSRNFGSRLIDEFQVLSMVEAGLMTGPGGERYGSIGIIVNCPMVFRFL
jgi:hypothetical protein